MTTKKELQDRLTQSVTTTEKNYETTVKKKVDDAKTSLNNFSETKIGQANDTVTGGIQSVSNLTTDVTGKLNAGAVEGIVTDQLTALDGAVNDFGSQAAQTKGPIKIALSWSDPDSDGNVYLDDASIDISSQVDASINAMLAKLSGLNVFNGYVQKIAGNVVPKGQLSLLEKAKGKIGAFPSIDKLNEITNKANDLAATAETAINNAVSDVVGATLPPNPTAGLTNDDVGGNLAGALNGAPNAQTKLTNLGSDLTSAVSGSVDKVTNGITKGININQNKLIDDFAQQTGKDGRTVIDAASKGLTSDLNDLKGGLESYDRTVGVFLSDSKTGVLQGFGQKQSDKEADKLVAKLAPKLTSTDRDDVVALYQGTPAERSRAIDIISRSSGKNPEEIKNSLDDLNTTIAGTILVANEESAFNDPFRLSSTEDESLASAKFSYVSSVEELQAEMNNISRDITEVVVHWTDTYSNKNIGSEEINTTQKELGSESIGYHYVIRRDGSLQRGRPVNKQGDHALINGHDEYSIGLVFVGGINAPSGTAFPGNFRSVSSLTLSQMNTFNEFCKAFYERYPGGQILGHNDIDPLEEDPGFDVRDYVEDIFNKKSLFEDPSARGPFTPSELVSTRIPE